MSTRGRWADLLPRTLSAIALIAVGGTAVYFGGLAFTLLVTLAAGGILWEITRMLAPGRQDLALSLGSMAAACIFVAALTSPVTAPVLLLVPVLVGGARIGQEKRIFTAVCAWVLLASLGLIWLRANQGLGWTIWLISVVVATDVAGYFVGKYMGGRKFWPRISPKKTWSGTAGGWAAAALTGLGFALISQETLHLVWVSVLLSLSSQMGDIVESALKRRAGVKDASNLIPGHGGLFDRFDGLLGAAAMAMVLIAYWS